MNTTKNTYFASDFHLGAPSYESSLEREKRIVAWLEEVRVDAAEIFLIGDVFDFWFEYKRAIPKGCLLYTSNFFPKNSRSISVLYILTPSSFGM